MAVALEAKCAVCRWDSLFILNWCLTYGQRFYSRDIGKFVSFDDVLRYYWAIEGPI